MTEKFTTPSYRGKVPKEVEKTLDIIIQFVGSLSERLEGSEAEGRRRVEAVIREQARFAGLVGARGQRLIGDSTTDPLLEQVGTGQGTVQSFSASAAGNLSASVTNPTTNPALTISLSSTPSFTSVTVNGAKVSAGNGTPEGAVVGSVGDLFLRRDGGASTTLYIKESGSATNTGWVAK